MFSTKLSILSTAGKPLLVEKALPNYKELLGSSFLEPFVEHHFPLLLLANFKTTDWLLSQLNLKKKLGQVNSSWKPFYYPKCMVKHLYKNL